jgi:hypothetical protein
MLARLGAGVLLLAATLAGLLLPSERAAGEREPASPHAPVEGRPQAEPTAAPMEVPALAAFLAMTALPPTLPVGGDPVEALFVQLLDAEGRAAVRSVPTAVRIASSDPRIATAPASAEIAAGESAVVVPVTVRDEGSVTFTAQAAGLASAQARLAAVRVTTTAEGGTIGIEFAPRVFIAGAGGPAWLTVSLLTAENGEPRLAAQPTEVRLVSSNPGAVGVPPAVTIPAGQFSVTVDVTVGDPGQATVSALRSGFVTGRREVRTGSPNPQPTRLEVVAVPSRLLSGGPTSTRLVLQATAEGAPAFFPCGAVELSTSRPGVTTLAERVVPDCQPGWHAVVVTTSVGAESGTTTVTAAMPGLEPGEANIAASGRAPARLVASLAPSALVYGAPSAGWLVVQVADAGGSPAPVPADLVVTIAGPSDVVPPEAVIPRGSTSTLVALGSLPEGFGGTLDVSVPGMQPASVELRRPPAAVVPPLSPRGGVSPAFNLAGIEVPVLWLLVLLFAATAGLALVAIWSSRWARR